MGREVALLTAAGAVALLIGWSTGAIESTGEWLVGHTPLGFDVLTALLLVIALGCAAFARRHYRREQAARRELVRLSLQDTLTDLPNRRMLGPWVAADIASSQLQGAYAAVLFVDLDRFKHVNDRFGHATGDRLMRAVAERLRTACAPGQRVVRFGGDEFVLLCPGLAGAAAAEKIAHRVIQALEQPFTVDDQTLRISACVGAALAEHHVADPDDVIRDADVAMYQAKALGAGRVVLFDRSMAGALTPASAARQIRSALDDGEFHLHYQPVVDLETGRIVGAEALLRWISPERGTMSPSEFVPILEETGLIVPVGTWILQEACRQAARLHELLDGAPPLAITVNVSARQLTQDGFADVVADAMHRAGVPEGQMHLEITEGALMHDVDSAWAVLRQAKALGVKLALDDFGTGYSSLSYVRRFSLDMLKIDKSFIDGLDTSTEDRAIVEHVIGMADALGMVTVAEGVERPEQLAWLRRLGCRLAQGFALSRPLAASDLEALLLRRKDDPYRIGPVSDGPIVLSAPDPASLVPTEPPPLLFEDPETPRSRPTGSERPGETGAPETVTTGDRPAVTGEPALAGSPRASGSGLPRLREYRRPQGDSGAPPADADR